MEGVTVQTALVNLATDLRVIPFVIQWIAFAVGLVFVGMGVNGIVTTKAIGASAGAMYATYTPQLMSIAIGSVLMSYWYFIGLGSATIQGKNFGDSLYWGVKVSGQSHVLAKHGGVMAYALVIMVQISGYIKVFSSWLLLRRVATGNPKGETYGDGIKGVGWGLIAINLVFVVTTIGNTALKTNNGSYPEAWKEFIGNIESTDNYMALPKIKLT